jgi:hypothetical protein
MPPNALSPPSPTKWQIVKSDATISVQTPALTTPESVGECHQKIPVYDDLLFEVGSRPAANKHRGIQSNLARLGMASVF